MYEELYEENRGLLHALARRYATACKLDRAVSVEDLKQAGFFGLVIASQTYDPERGGSWPSWAARYIHREMLAALGYRWQPSTGTDDPDGSRYRPTRAHTGAYSLDAPLAADDPEGLTWADTLADDSLPDADEAVNLAALQRYVREAVERLQSHQQRVVMDLCGLQELPYEAAAAALGVSVERVRQIRGAALKKLRDDATLRENAAADADLDLCTPYYTRVTVAAFQSTHTSATEKAVLWRLDHEERMKRERDRLIQLEQALSRDSREAQHDKTGNTPAERNEHNEQDEHQPRNPSPVRPRPGMCGQH